MSMLRYIWRSFEDYRCISRQIQAVLNERRSAGIAVWLFYLLAMIARSTDAGDLGGRGRTGLDCLSTLQLARGGGSEGACADGTGMALPTQHVDISRWLPGDWSPGKWFLGKSNPAAGTLLGAGDRVEVGFHWQHRILAALFGGADAMLDPVLAKPLQGFGHGGFDRSMTLGIARDVGAGWRAGFSAAVARSGDLDLRGNAASLALDARYRSALSFGRVAIGQQGIDARLTLAGSDCACTPGLRPRANVSYVIDRGPAALRLRLDVINPAGAPVGDAREIVSGVELVHHF
jgi:hypothetical protein